MLSGFVRTLNCLIQLRGIQDLSSFLGHGIIANIKHIPGPDEGGEIHNTNK